MWTPKGRLVGIPLVKDTLRQLETVIVRNPDLRKYVT
jgi:hypothetical protein